MFVRKKRQIGDKSDAGGDCWEERKGSFAVPFLIVRPMGQGWRCMRGESKLYVYREKCDCWPYATVFVGCLFFPLKCHGADEWMNGLISICRCGCAELNWKRAKRQKFNQLEILVLHLNLNSLNVVAVQTAEWSRSNRAAIQNIKRAMVMVIWWWFVVDNDNGQGTERQSPSD